RKEKAFKGGNRDEASAGKWSGDARETAKRNIKPPRTSRNGQHPTFQTVPAATALSFLPLGFLQKCAPLATHSPCLMRAFVRFQRQGELMCWSWAFPLLTKVDLACGGLLGWWRRR